MSTHKHIDKICLVALALVLIVTLVFMNGNRWNLPVMKQTMGYETRLFDASTVHSIEIVMDDWDEFLEECENEEYVSCTVIIDNEIYKNVGIRAKGNTSLSSVAASGSDRYSFKIEFDQYESGKSYYGLDKISLNNIIQDNTYMKDYLTYQLMGEFGVSAPLCSYAQITVNGEVWGLYLAVECVEESFLTRNYGNDYGELYKPDSMSMGGGRGNGRDFDSEGMMEEFAGSMEQPEGGRGFEGMEMPEKSESFGDMPMPGRGFGGGMGNSDVKLQYTDDDPDSYSNIFDNAKTDITAADQTRLIEALESLSGGEDIAQTVDVESVIRYFVVHNFVCNSDSYTGMMVHNYYLYEEDGQLSMIPWDYNLAFGGFSGGSDATGTVNEPIDTPVSGGSTEDRPMISWIFESEEYTEIYHQYFAEFVEEYGAQGKLEEMIASVYEMIAPYVEQDPTKFCTYEEFETGVATLGEFCKLRLESISGQLDGSIPSTTSGQSQDSSARVDASHISISDMGSMGNMGGGFQGGFNEYSGNMSIPEMPEGMQPPGGMEMPEGMQPPGGMEFPEGMELPNGMQPPGGMSFPGNGRHPQP